MLSSAYEEVTVTVDAILPFQADYDQGQLTVERSLLIGIGPLLVGDSRYENNGVLTARVPSKLPPGVYDVSLTLVGDRRYDVVPNAFTVTPGAWPAGYSIDTISSPQAVNTPFIVTIRATGANATTFAGTVDIQDSRGLTQPTPTGPFTAGVREQSMTFTTSGAGITLTVRDLPGTTATSNPFTVN